MSDFMSQGRSISTAVFSHDNETGGSGARKRKCRDTAGSYAQFRVADIIHIEDIDSVGHMMSSIQLARGLIIGVHRSTSLNISGGATQEELKPRVEEDIIDLIQFTV